MKKTNDFLTLSYSCKRILLIICTFIGVLIVLLTSLMIMIMPNYRPVNAATFQKTQETNKVILMIGDGMGFNHINATRAYYEKDSLNLHNLPLQGSVTTHSLTTTGPTDSAAAGTALATGQKVNNYEVALHDGKPIESISEYAQSLNLGVGIVCTDYLYGATPAAFSCHTSDRNNGDDIVSQQLTSNIDLFLGAGNDIYFHPFYRTVAEEKDYTMISEYQDLSLSYDKILGAFSKVSRNDHTNETPTLSKLTEFAIEYMEFNFPDGYFLMIEGSHIDKRSHSNDIFQMMEYLYDFDKAIGIVDEFVQLVDDAAVIVTADHETGGLNYRGESPANINDELYTVTTHTSANVPYYIRAGITNIPAIIDNTDIYRLCRILLSA